MAAMKSVYDDIRKMGDDGMSDYEIAEVISYQYDIDLDFAYVLIEEVIEDEENR